MGFGSEGTRKGASSNGKGVKRAASRFGVRKAASDPPSLADVTGLGAIIDAAAAEGDALTFGRTSDGGAVAITVLSDGGREKAYAATQEELNALIVALATAYGLYQDGT